MSISIKKLKTDSSNENNFYKTGQVTANLGGSYNVHDLKPHDVSVPFIALSLSKICRYIGHVGNRPEHFYSVAQHSVMMAEAILLVYGDPMIAMQALMHDAPEAYIGDMISPLKRDVGDKIKPVEDRIEEVIFNTLDIDYPLDPIVKHVDINICLYEIEFLVKVKSNDTILMDLWGIEKSYDQFINMYDKLDLLIKASRR